MIDSLDAIIVGGGHNGLVCAAYLARAGRKVLVLEAASQLGGAAVTGEIAPGFKVSRCAHLLHSLHPKIAADLNLAQHGLAFSTQDMATVALDREGHHLLVPGHDTTSLRGHSPADATAWPRFNAQLQRFANILHAQLARIPPRLGTRNRADLMNLGRLLWSIRRLGREDMREFLRIAGMNVAHLLADNFECDLLRGAVAFDAVAGARLGPRSPNSVLTLLYRLAGEGGYRLSHPRGGMGAVTQALAKAAQSAGSEIRVRSRVARIIVENDRATGVKLIDGEKLHARCVVSNADPRRTMLSLLGTEHLDTGFVRCIRDIPMIGVAAKLNLALDALPSFANLDSVQLAGRLVIAPGIDYIERAFNHAKYGEYSELPAIEITIPSVHDASLVTDGRHVMSAVIQYAPYDLRTSWGNAREDFADKVVNVIAAYAPDIKDRIVARELLTPVDIEHEFGMTGGHWHHGELGLDRFLMLRPVPGMAQYATPLPGLYLCGAGAHPGGHVMGAAGMNAAKQVLAGG
ncbi:MAG: phytoene desaturase family protein [Gammaproteobacteria bacterium]